MNADDLPEPLVPLDHDVSMLSDFRLNVDRLLASELLAIGTAEECWAAFMLWCRAWKQQPGGSLPNDDRILAGFSGAGRRWKQVREVALHGFVLCSDGRLYHRFLCDEVRRAYVSHLANETRRDADKKRLKAWRDTRTAESAGWEGVRKAVFARDGNQCTECQSADDLHCDHIVPLRHGGSNDASNMQTLCRSCHGKKTATERHLYARETRTECISNGGRMPFVAEEPEPKPEPQKERTVADATGAEAPPDPLKAMWVRGRALLGKSSGALIGKARKEHGDEAVVTAILAGEREQPVEPIAFFIGCLRGQTRKRSAVEKLYAGAMEAADELTRRQQANGGPDFTPLGPLLDRR